MGTGLRRNIHALKIRLELPAADAGDLRTDATQVLLLTAGRHLVAKLSGLPANTALPSHRTPRINESILIFRI